MDGWLHGRPTPQLRRDPARVPAAGPSVEVTLPERPVYLCAVRQGDRGPADAPHAGRRVRIVALLAAALLAPALLVAPAAVTPVRAGEPTDRLPDLRAAKPGEFHIVTSGGRRLLRFTAVMSNRGAGAMEILAVRPSSRDPWDVDQRIYDTAGGSHRVQTEATLRYAGDGHGHWHVEQMMGYHLWSSAGTRGDDKVGFCFFDTTLVDAGLRGSPSSGYYREAWCGGQSATRSRTGISVGWGDRYAWNLAFQRIDITGLPGGVYTIRARVDPQGWFTQSKTTNDCAWTRINVPTRGTTVTVLASGTTCVNDYVGTMFEPYVEWAYERGITGGCELDLFCTGDSLTRAQAASFVARALALPPATQDWFSDDDGRSGEADINRLAEAGIIQGCAEGLYCPADTMTRGHMASMLVRGLALPAAVRLDRFVDDDGSTHEADIDALAEAGITGGCDADRFCPTKPVTRGQMVTFLYRGLTA